MPPRTPFPARGNMGANMGGNMARNQFRNQAMRQPGFGPGMRVGRMGGNPNQQGSGGGLLSKILGKGNSRAAGSGSQAAGIASAAARSSTSAGGGLLKTLANPTAISGFLTNTQKVLNTAGQLGPIVQQYGPLVKNLPAMWKLYRGLSNSEVNTNEKMPSSPATKERKKATQSNTKSKPTTPKRIPIETNEKPSTKGKSVPKIYV